MRKLIRGVVTGACAVAVGFGGFSATAVATDDANGGRPGGSADGLNADVLAAMKRDVGLDAAEAKARAAVQAKSLKADKALKGKLGGDFAGSWLDAKSGKLVVAVTDADDVAAVKAAGAQARVVEHSKAKLDGIVAEFDRKAGKIGSAAERKAPGKRQAAVAGLSAWRVDAATNEVVVSVVKGKQDSAAVKALAKYGDAVRVEQLPATPTSTEFMDGGDEINGNCSAGFNLRNPSTGQGYLLTAGHCVTAGSWVYSRGSFFGTTLERWFPTFDDAIIRKDGSGWYQGPWVDTNPSQGGVVNVYGYSDAPVGTLICKSGKTTKLTCGYIRGKDETVTFDGTNTVYGLTRHDACVEKGDSGGANYQYASTRTAEGVTSGASLYGTAKRCGSAVGQQTISWYFPIADSMAFYGPKYGVQVW